MAEIVGGDLWELRVIEPCGREGRREHPSSPVRRAEHSATGAGKQEIVAGPTNHEGGEFDHEERRNRHRAACGGLPGSGQDLPPGLRRGPLDGGPAVEHGYVTDHQACRLPEP